MSHQTDIVLLTGILDVPDGYENNGRVDELSDWLYSISPESNVRLVPVQDYAGGVRAYQSGVFLAKSNWVNEDDLIKKFRSIKWESPESAQLLLRYEEESRFRVYTVAQDDDTALLLRARRALGASAEYDEDFALIDDLTKRLYE